MSKFVLVSVTLLSMTSFAGLKLGEMMPEQTTKMMATSGKEVTIQDIKGSKGTLVIFSCNHCPYAKAWDARIAEIGKEAVQKGVGTIMINSNDPNVNKADSMEVMKTKTYAFPYVVDSTSNVARAFGAEKTPDIFLFNPKGELVYKGAVDDNSEDVTKVKNHFLKDAINDLTMSRKIATAETKAVGCGIKFRK